MSSNSSTPKAPKANSKVIQDKVKLLQEQIKLLEASAELEKQLENLSKTEGSNEKVEPNPTNKENCSGDANANDSVQVLAVLSKDEAEDQRRAEQEEFEMKRLFDEPPMKSPKLVSIFKLFFRLWNTP